MPLEDRIYYLHPKKLKGDPQRHLQEAIWALIRKNAIPEENIADWSGRTPRVSPVQDDTAQVFYVVYPAADTSYGPALGSLHIAELEEQVASEMIGAPEYDLYIRKKIGTQIWDAAVLKDSNDPNSKRRIEVLLEHRLVYVIVAPVHNGRKPFVVATESLVAEISRIQHLANRDPFVLGQVELKGPGYINLHIRERLSGAQNDRAWEKKLPLLEGRNRHEFTIGPNEYDDIVFPHLGPKETYRLVITNHLSSLLDPVLRSAKGEVVPSPSIAQSSSRYWNIGSAGYKVSFSPIQKTPLSQYRGAPSPPPTILIEGRVLPSQPLAREVVPVELARQVSPQPQSWIPLDQGLFLYQTLTNEVRLLNITPSRSVRVRLNSTATTQNQDTSYTLVDGSVIEIDNGMYIWRSASNGFHGLPTTVLGLLSPALDKDKQVEAMFPPTDVQDAHRWLLGRWQGQVAAASESDCLPLFPLNPDGLLAGKGTLILQYGGANRYRHHWFSLLLRRVDEIYLCVKPYGSNSWLAISWPGDSDWKERPTGSGGSLAECPIPNVILVGVANHLIVGSSYYNIKTSFTP